MKFSFDPRGQPIGVESQWAGERGQCQCVPDGGVNDVHWGREGLVVEGGQAGEGREHQNPVVTQQGDNLPPQLVPLALNLQEIEYPINRE